MVNSNKNLLYAFLCVAIYLAILIPFGILFKVSTTALIIRSILGSIIVGVTCFLYLRNKNNSNHKFDFLEVFRWYFKVLVPIALVFGIISLFIGIVSLVNKGINSGANFFFGMGFFLILAAIIIFLFLRKAKKTPSVNSH
jgi:hypothetical protein